MKKYKAILFDMDGTLVPMDMDTFVNGYFKGLCKRLVPFGVDAKTIIDGVWAGTKAMVMNNGLSTNNKAFWKTFEKYTGLSEERVGKTTDEFYSNEFNDAKQFTGENPLAKKAVEIAKTKADKVVLATNPLFPYVAQKTRMSWVGLSEDDFELITHYESDSFCKPNPNYFLSVCGRIGIKPEECLMIGNDEEEDAYACQSIGMDCYIVTDSLVKSEKHPYNGPKGSFEEMIKMLESL